MRQFVLAGNVAYPSETELTSVAAGAAGFYYNDNGQLKADADGTKITREGMLVVGRAVSDGGPIVLPIFKNNFSYVKSEYQASTQFSATIVIAQPKNYGEYSLIVVKKGMKFNYRNKWTATVLVTDLEMTADALAEKLVKQINNNSENHGVSASNASGTITVTGIEKGTDYTVIGADNLEGQEVTISTAGIPAINDAKYITDLSNKAAADAGIEYTYRDDVNYLYPNYPVNPLKAADAADKGFTVITIKFSEPRDVKTKDDVVNQIIQVAFPTGATGLAAFETACKNLAGIATE